MRFSIIIISLFIFEIAHSQQGRILGAQAFQVDDGAGHTLTWDVASPLSLSYQLHFPNSLPPDPFNYLVSDANGNMVWTANALGTLPPGNIWRGSILGIAEAMPPGAVGSMLSIDALSMPIWTMTIPAQITISASQITSGTLQTGTIIGVGPGAILYPVSFTLNGPVGIINANLLSGSGIGKYSGKISIATGVDHLEIPYALITALSSITVSVSDPQAKTFGFVDAIISTIIPGTGFTVIFSADYPNSGTGVLHYTIVNP